MTSTIPTSARILDTAQALVVTGGYNGFSYADIASAIGIRKPSIHHHFPTKADLVSALVDRYRRQAEAGLQSLQKRTSNPADQLQSYLDFWQTCIRDDSQSFCVCAMLASEMQLLPDEVASRVRAHFDGLAQWLTSVLRAGAAQKVFRLVAPPEEEAQMLMASVHGAMLSARAFGRPELFIAIVAPHVARLRAPNG